MPPVKTPDAPADTTTAEAPKPPEGYTQSPDATENTVGFIDDLLNLADSLKDEKVKLTERIGANRDALRSMVTQNLASPEQAGEILALYPERTRKTDTENGNGDKPADK